MLLEDTLTVEEVAASLRLTGRGVRKMATRGDIPAYKIGRLWRIPRISFLRWLRKTKNRPWRPSTSAATPIGSASATVGRKSDGQLKQLLGLKLSDILTTSNQNTGA